MLLTGNSKSIIMTELLAIDFFSFMKFIKIFINKKKSIENESQPDDMTRIRLIFTISPHLLLVTCPLEYIIINKMHAIY